MRLPRRADDGQQGSFANWYAAFTTKAPRYARGCSRLTYAINPIEILLFCLAQQIHSAVQ